MLVKGTRHRLWLVTLEAPSVHTSHVHSELITRVMDTACWRAAIQTPETGHLAARPTRICQRLGDRFHGSRHHRQTRNRLRDAERTPTLAITSSRKRVSTGQARAKLPTNSHQTTHSKTALRRRQTNVRMLVPGLPPGAVKSSPLDGRQRAIPLLSATDGQPDGLCSPQWPDCLHEQ